MKLTITRPVEVEALSILVNVPVRYGTEDIPADFPCRRPWRKGDTRDDSPGRRCDRWEVIVDIDTGRIRNWPAGKTGTVFMKVCDEGNYTLLDQNGDALARITEDYVPECIPGKYGDYVHFDIGEDGSVTDWEANPQNVRDSFFRETES